MQIAAERVRQLREARGLTQGQLAYKADTTSFQISRLENGERPGAQAVLLGRIAAVLGTSVDYLLGTTIILSLRKTMVAPVFPSRPAICSVRSSPP